MSVRDKLRSTIIGNNKAQELVNQMYENGFTAKAVVQYTSSLMMKVQKNLQRN